MRMRKYTQAFVHVLLDLYEDEKLVFPPNFNKPINKEAMHI